MAELKHTFVKGRMNKDLDERLIPNGEYRDALNIQISSSEGSDTGAVENILGNTELFDLGLTNAKCIGTAKDLLNKKIYWFITSDNIDGIYEYDVTNNDISPILIDKKEKVVTNVTDLSFLSGFNDEYQDYLTIRGLSEQELLNVFFSGGKAPAASLPRITDYTAEITAEERPDLSFTIPKNTVVKEVSPNGGEGIWVFEKINNINKDAGDLNVTFTSTTGSLLNFQKNNLITGANILEGLLFFTDNLNEPRVIDINKFKRNSKELKLEDGTISSESNTKITDSSGVRLVYDYDISVAKRAPQAAPSMTLSNTLRDGVVELSDAAFNFYQDNPIPSQPDYLPVPGGANKYFTKSYSVLPDWKKDDIIIFEFEGEKEEAEAKAKINNITGNKVQFEILSYSELPENKNYYVRQILQENDAIYELKFPRFAYRWKFDDNTYSTFSPFTEPAFYPKEFKYDGKKGFNEGVTNNIRKINLNNISTGPSNVKSIDILLKFDDDNNVYIIDTKKKPGPTNLNFEITKEKIKSTVPNIQLLRQWDNVPRKAKAQEIISNRVVYGNYVQNYNFEEDIEISSTLKHASRGLKRSIKSNRNYEFGVVYVDEFNRQTPVLSGKDSSFFVSKNESVNVNKFNLKINNNPPAWATHFKYFIKESSAEYYNLAADRMYFDEENGFCYISFPSSERNKITEENYLLLKKNHGADTPVTDPDNRYKILDIFAEPPEFIHEKLEQVASYQNVLFAPSYGAGSTVSTKTSGSTPVPNNTVIQIRSVNTTGTISSEADDQGFNDDEKAGLVVGRYVKFYKDNQKSKAYKISSVRFHSSGGDAAEGEIKFSEPFGNDVNFIYTDSTDDSSSIRPDIEIRVYRDSANAGDPEFNGRFFVKVQSNSTLVNSVSETDRKEGDVEYYAKYSAQFDGIDRNYDNFQKKGTGGVKSTPLFMRWGGTRIPGSGAKNGERKLIGSKEAHVTLEQTGPVDDDSLLRNIEVGSRLKFSNHDTIYRVGALRVEDYDGPRRNSSTVQIYHIRFEDEDGNEQRLTQDIVTNGTKLDPNFLTVELLVEKEEDTAVFVKNPAIFETEPLAQTTELDIYYETEKAFPIQFHGQEQEINWYNCFSFGNGVESNRIRDDFNAPYIKNGVKASAVLEEGYEEERKFNGLIWSGVVNSKSSVNNSNQFIQAESITKDFLPSYGKIQKLHAWDDSVVVFLENKILRAPADKDALFNADGSTNLIASRNVIGNPIEYNGDFGISNDPHSFASFGYRCYFVDRKNSKVMRLSKDGLTPISNINMNDFFRDRLSGTQTIFGSFDERNKMYNLTFATDEDTVCFSESVNGWVTRKSFVPDWACSLNSRYYTFKDSGFWLHDVESVDRNNFYGTNYNSEIKLEINDDPSSVKRFRTLSYEGTKDWEATVKTDQESSSDISFINKENKYFANIKGEVKTFSQTSSNLDLKKFNFQGIGRPATLDDIPDNRVKTKITFTLVNNSGGYYPAGFTSGNQAQISGYSGDRITKSTVTLGPIRPTNPAYKFLASDFKAKNCTFTQNGDGVSVTYTHGIDAYPDGNELVRILFEGVRFYLKDATVSGSYTVDLSGCTDSTGNGTYSITGKPGDVVEIGRRIIFPNDDYSISAADLSINNAKISAHSDIIKNEQTGNIEIIERTVIPTLTEYNRNYIVKLNAEAIPPEVKYLHSISNLSDYYTLENNLQSVEAIVTNDIYASYGWRFKRGSTILQERTVKQQDSSSSTIDLDFTATDYNSAATYTLEFFITDSKDPVSGKSIRTDFAGTFVTSPITFTRAARSAKEVQVKVYHDDLDSTAHPTGVFTNRFKGFNGDSIEKNVSIELTLDSTKTYSKIKDIAASDFVFTDGTNEDGVQIKDIELTIGTSPNQHVATLNFTLTVDEMTQDLEIITIELDDFVNKDVTITVAYSDTNMGSDYTGSFVNSYTQITGIAGAPNTKFDNVEYAITMASGQQFLDGDGENSIQAREWKLYDGSTDVTSTYDSNGTLQILDFTSKKATISFNPGNFAFPNSDKTLTIKPSRDIAEAEPSDANDYIVKIKNILPAAIGKLRSDEKSSISIWRSKLVENENWSYFSSKISDVITETATGSATYRLVQFVYKIDRAKAINTGDWGSIGHTVSFHDEQINTIFDISEGPTIPPTEITKATAGTYTPIGGGDDITITGPFVLSDNDLTLTINLLVDIEDVTSNNKSIGVIDIDISADVHPNYVIDVSDPAPTRQDACNLNKTGSLRVYTPDNSNSNGVTVGSFLSTSTGKRVSFPWDSDYTGTNAEYVYFKDFTNSKIIQYPANGVGGITEISDLCEDISLPVNGKFILDNAKKLYEVDFFAFSNKVPISERPDYINKGFVLFGIYANDEGGYAYDKSSFNIIVSGLTEADANKFDENSVFANNYGKIHKGYTNKKYSRATFGVSTVDAFNVSFTKQINGNNSKITFRISNYSHAKSDLLWSIGIIAEQGSSVLSNNTHSITVESIYSNPTIKV